MKLYVLFKFNLILRFLGSKPSIYLSRSGDLPEFNIIKKLENKKTLSISSLCFLEDKRLVSCSKDGVITIYGRDSYKPEITIAKFDNVMQETLTVCGLKDCCLASSGGQSYDIIIWKIEKNTFYNLFTLKGHSYIISKIIELEDKKLCSCSFDCTIKIWDNNKSYQCIKTIRDHKDTVESLVEIGNYIISASSFEEDNTVRVWSKSTFQCNTVINNIYCHDSNGLSKLKENTIILGGYNELFIVEIVCFKVKNFKDDDLGGVWCLNVLRNGKVLIGNHQGMIFCFDEISSQILAKKEIAKEGISCIIENEEKILFSSFDNIIVIFN